MYIHPGNADQNHNKAGLNSNGTFRLNTLAVTDYFTVH